MPSDHKRRLDLFTMGCSKNLVDSEKLLRQLDEAGFRLYHNPEQTHGGVAVVNTCGFIRDAKQESIDMILELCALKAQGKLAKVYVMGCLSERYLQTLEKEIPEVDRYFGKFDWPALLGELQQTYRPELQSARLLTTPSHYAYLKISEGCDRSCAYCAIPLMTGHHRSRPMEEIVAEAQALAGEGVKELQVIAQELTFYGIDNYGRQALPQLVEQLSDVPGIEWIRLHYAYPDSFPRDLLRVIRERSNVCRYLDIALQHIADPVLTRMRRHTTGDETRELIRILREEVPGIALRTTLMVGFPGETEQDFEELLHFVEEARFERMGAFSYSEEEGTFAAENYPDDVPPETKQRRLDTLMELQATISADIAAARVGTVLRTIVDRIEGEFYVGRTEFDSPEVDGEVLIPLAAAKLTPGLFYNIEITGSDEYDLYGKPVAAPTL